MVNMKHAFTNLIISVAPVGGLTWAAFMATTVPTLQWIAALAAGIIGAIQIFKFLQNSYKWFKDKYFK
jgi:hypothetical protein